MVLSTDQIKKEQEEEDAAMETSGEMSNLTLAHANCSENDNPNKYTLTESDSARAEHSQHREETDNISNQNFDADSDLDQKLHQTDAETDESAETISPNENESRDGEENSPELGRKLTNFSIDQILRADFGPKKRRYVTNDRVRHFPASPFMMSSPASLFSPLYCAAASASSPSSSSSRFLSSSVLSAFSSPIRKSSACLSKHSSRESYFNHSLTPPPSSPESSSSLSPSSTSSSSRHARIMTSPASSKKEIMSSGSHVTSVASAVTSPEAKGVLDPNSETASAKQLRWPAWVYCTRYSDRPSSGPRYRKPRQSKPVDKRPRTAFSTSQLQRLRSEFQDCPYLSESRRITLARELGLSESQVKIWFQNKRAKLKKGYGVRNPLAQLLMEEGLYNHSTIIVREDDNDSSQRNNGSEGQSTSVKKGHNHAA